MSSPYFVQAEMPGFQPIVDKVYARARAEAARVAAAKGIGMKIEFLKPVHLNRTLYNLPGSADTLYTLKSNVAIFPYGILNVDPTFDYMKWYQGNKTKYIGDWFVRPIYFFEEKQGAYHGRTDAYEFRGDESFTINCHSTTSSALIEAWLMAFAVMPVTLEEVKIIA